LPLNKLENFIKSTDGRIIFVNPSDINSTDAISNDGTSLTSPFKSIQRAILEAARFSYLRGNDNDIVEKTTVLLFPGEHIVDNRPGFAIKKSNDGLNAIAVSPSGVETFAQDELSLSLTSNFDLTQNNNILYKFNSINGGVVVPRGTSIVGLDLRKTKIRAKYVPNPTDSNAVNSAIFRITGACYFWQFSIFDGDENGLVYTDPRDFSQNNQSRPTFSHHKLTCFEYADGVNIPTGYEITDLDMYYSKVSNAFNNASGRNIDQKYPSEPGGLAKQRPEWEIVGAFAPDPVNLTSIISGDGSTPGPVVTVTTAVPHGLTAETPIKIRGVNVDDYNISTKVQNVLNETSFTYVLPFVRNNLPAGSSAGLSGASATVTIETDTVSGASPYIFNVSLRSVWGMNGMHADGSKAAGFRSMVVAQFTAVSLQKDDRAFVKYNKNTRTYDSISITPQTGAALASGSSSTNIATVYHLDPLAIYRQGWQSTHIKITNDAFIQIVSVFAIGFNKHFGAESGGDASITNSNSNFGQFSLSSDGFKKEAFDKDNKAFITSVVTPRAITIGESNVDWIALDVNKIQQVGIASHLYLFGFNNVDVPPPVLTQGYRIGARRGDILYVNTPEGTKTANILMTDNDVSVGSGNVVATGTKSSEKSYSASTPVNSVLAIGSHTLLTGEKIRIFSETGDLPENLENNTIYYAITSSTDGTLSPTEIKIASSKTNSEAATPINITISGGSQLKVVSRVSDKAAGELGSPIQWDQTNGSWYILTNQTNDIYPTIQSLGVAGLTERTNVTFVKRFDDDRSLDEKLYKIRVVVPKELVNARDPVEGFIIQESSTTGVRNDGDFTLATITAQDFLYNRNPRFITSCSFDGVTQTITVLTDHPHNLKVGDQVVIKNVTSSTNTSGTVNQGYNGTFTITGVTNDKTFTYGSTDIFGVVHIPGTFTNNTDIRSVSLPRFERNDNKGNYFVYRTEVITPYQFNVQDGVYYVYMLNAGNTIPSEFTNLKYSQNVVDLYPQLDKDNIEENPPAASTFAKRSPLGDVVTNDLKRSITRESVDKFHHSFNLAPFVVGVTTTGGVGGTATLTFAREHGLAGIVTFSSLTAGSGHSDGTYYNVKLFNSNAAPSVAVWDGATARVTVVGGAVVNAEITEGGSGYANGETLWFDSSKIGGTPTANITIATSGISTATGNVIQVTGLGTATDAYYRIASVPAKNQIAIAYTGGDPAFSVGQYVVNISHSIDVSSTTYDSTTGITTFTCSSAHGLLAGNRFRVLDTSNNNLGDFIVDEKPDNSVLTFTAKTSKQLSSPRFILKHAFSGNEATADGSGENLGIRGVSFYANERLILSSAINNIVTNFAVQLPTGLTGLLKRFPLGSYIQIDNEIMRIVSSTLTGSGNDEIQVIRGVMGTIAERHLANSLIKKIKPLSIELRRPSIIRASGHTFEYLGYGPGNYSTGLPQIQSITLTEREEFLSQSQESACGSVLYSGMNNNGDFFNGNTKTVSSSGRVVSYDIPKPTVTGQDPSRLSVIFDEVIVKERLIVEGGNSSTVLSQFDGPVTFNKELKMNDTVNLNGLVKINNNVEITDPDDSTNTLTGALVIAGGVGIGKSVNIGGDLDVIGITSISNTTESTTKDNGALVVEGGVGIEKNLNVGGNLTITGTANFNSNTNFNSNVRFGDNDHLYFGDGDDLDIFHDGSNSYIDDRGTGVLYVRGNGGVYIQKFTGESMIDANADSSVTLYFDNSAKLSTTNIGISVSGEISATGDIIAFASDERLKTNIQPLENALEKVMRLSGFTYNFNEVGGELGFNTEITYVGVSAQEVQAVLPEAVKPAPADPNYITVQYEKLVPLLIEAIKELKTELDELKAKM
jgi:hypothetical protein